MLLDTYRYLLKNLTDLQLKEDVYANNVSHDVPRMRIGKHKTHNIRAEQQEAHQGLLSLQSLRERVQQLKMI